MRLEASRIYLRELKASDASGNYPNWLNDKEVCRYNSHGDIHYTKEMVLEYIKSVNENSLNKVFAICEKLHNNTLIAHKLMRSGMSKEDLDDVVMAFEKVWENREEF